MSAMTDGNSLTAAGATAADARNPTAAPVSRRLVRILIGLALAGMIALPFFVSGYIVYVANMLMVYVVLALGMHFVIGEAGQFSLAHAALYGVGIYTAGLLNNAFHPSMLLCILAGGLVATLLGVIVSGLALRMREIYLAIATFSFGEAMQWVFLNWEPVTGGTSGLRISPAQIFGYVLVSDKQAYPVVVMLALAFIGLALWLSRSGLGSSMRAVRESDVAAMAMGINVKGTKVTAFAISAFFAGCAGGMFTSFSSFIHPESLGFQTTILVLTMVIVGGIGSVMGAIGGAIIFGLVSELLRQFYSFQEMIYGGILMLFMMYLPKGLFASGLELLFQKQGDRHE